MFDKKQREARHCLLKRWLELEGWSTISSPGSRSRSPTWNQPLTNLIVMSYFDQGLDLEQRVSLHPIEDTGRRMCFWKRQGTAKGQTVAVDAGDVVRRGISRVSAPGSRGPFSVPQRRKSSGMITYRGLCAVRHFGRQPRIGSLRKAVMGKNLDLIRQETE